MKAEYYNVIGVMSGTSLDGIDLAHIQLRIEDKKWSFEIIESETIGYSLDWINSLKVAVNFSINELDDLNQKYTQLLAEIISDFIKKYNIENLDAVC